MDNSASYRPASRSSRVVVAAVGASGVIPFGGVASINAVDWSQIMDSHSDNAALVADLKTLQTNVVRYAEFLREISQGKEE